MADGEDLLARRYRLIRRIGAGAMGEVWLAQDELLHRPVAIKQLLLDTDQLDRVDIDRAMREARLAARLSHPNAVSIHDLLIEDQRPVLVMEYVAGQTLAQRLRYHGPLSELNAVELFGQVAAALAAAHELEIIHRDVKPANILITDDGRAKLADFGIARSGAEASLTSTGMLVGTLAYMAPEVVQGDAADAASDMWSFGATLFTAIESRPPFEGRNVVDVLTRLVRDPPPHPAHAEHLAPLIRRLLARDPSARPSATQTAQEFRIMFHPQPELPSNAMAPLPESSASSVAAATMASRIPPDPPAGTQHPAAEDDLDAGPTRYHGQAPTVRRARLPLTRPSESAANPETERPVATGVPRRTHRRLLVVAGTLIAAVAALVVYGTNHSAGAHRSASKQDPIGHSSTTRSDSSGNSLHPVGSKISPPPARNVNAGTVYVCDVGTDSVSVIKPNATVADETIAVGAGPADAAVAPAGTPNAGTVYIPNASEGTVTVIGPNAATISTIAVGVFPGAVMIAPVGTPNAGTVYVLSGGALGARGTVSVIKPNASTVSTITVGVNPAGVALAPVGTPNAGTLYVSNTGGTLSVIRPNADRAGAIRVGGGDDDPGSIVVAPAGAPNAGTIYILNSNGGTQGTVSVIKPTATSVSTITVGFAPTGIEVAPMGTPNAGTVYVTNTNGGDAGSVSVIKPNASSSSTITAGIGHGPEAIAVAPSGTPNAGTVYVANGVGDTVSVIKPNARSAQMVTVGAGPFGIAVADADTPNAGTVYITLSDSTSKPGKVAVIKPNANSASSVTVGISPECLTVAP